MGKQEEIRAAKLPPNIRRLGLAVSGGADSTALLTLVAPERTAAGLYTCVLHVDHGIRTDSADDAEFVKGLAKQFNLPFFSTRLNIHQKAGESIEMAARRLRMAFFRRCVRRLKLDAIATGHHADDVAETLLMRLARGAGATGLSGMRPESSNDGLRIVRPLIALRDTDLRSFLTARGIKWHEDSTNADVSIARNRVRKIVLPFLEKNFDPSIRAHLAQSAEILREDDALLEDLAEHHASEYAESLALRRRIARNSLFAEGCHAGFRAVEEKLREKATAKNTPPVVECTDDSFVLTVSLTKGFERDTSRTGVLPARCWMSAKALKGRKLLVRQWLPGDRITPTGFSHEKKLQDIFVTAKVPPCVRAKLPIITDRKTKEVLWVPGYRVASSVAVESPTSPSILFSLTLSCERKTRKHSRL